MTPPKTLGKYEILRLLGKGSMGEVYLGKDPALDRPVALKVIQASTAFEAEGTLRFEREARTMAALSHPHIVTIYDFGIVEEGHFLAMEYLEGEDLDTLIKRGGHDKRVLLEALAQACEGLGCAHGRGIIHRDVKPGNILVAFQGGRPLAKLLDFGIASVDRSNLTETGVRMGTISYMAPEYLDSGKSTPGSDLFAVGVIIYEILAGGRKPFAGEGTHAILGAILHKPVEALLPSELQGIPAAVVEVMEKALRKDPAGRYSNAEELAAALRQALLQPVQATESQRILVGKGGDCLSLRVALRQARPGAVIAVLPGHYKEALLLDKEIHLVGEGDPEQILLEAPSGPCLTVNSALSSIRGLTLRTRDGSPAVALGTRQSSLEACWIGALQAASGARVTVRECRVEGLVGHPAILLERGANLELAQSQISNAFGVGLLLHPGARATAEDSRFEDNPGGSVELGPGSSAEFRRCLLHGSRFAGILAFPEAVATLEGCVLSGHEGAGVHALRGTQITLTACRLADNAGMGLSVVDGGRASLEDCELSGNGQPGLLLHRDGLAHLTRCRVTEGRSLGIACHAGAAIQLAGCLIRGNALGGILLGPEAKLPQIAEDTVLEDPVLK